MNTVGLLCLILNKEENPFKGMSQGSKKVLEKIRVRIRLVRVQNFGKYLMIKAQKRL